MSTHDKSGKPYAKLSELKVNDKVMLNASFSCHSGGETVLEQDEQGLYFKCKVGKHYISGQAVNGEHCVGIYNP